MKGWLEIEGGKEREWGGRVGGIDRERGRDRRERYR